MGRGQKAPTAGKSEILHHLVMGLFGEEKQGSGHLIG
jgi:hypothetical protein